MVAQVARVPISTAGPAGGKASSPPGAGGGGGDPAVAAQVDASVRKHLLAGVGKENV
jgi:hypothetical protein